MLNLNFGSLDNLEKAEIKSDDKAIFEYTTIPYQMFIALKFFQIRSISVKPRKIEAPPQEEFQNKISFRLKSILFLLTSVDTNYFMVFFGKIDFSVVGE
jgi:hypothetical protein